MVVQEACGPTQVGMNFQPCWANCEMKEAVSAPQLPRLEPPRYRFHTRYGLFVIQFCIWLALGRVQLSKPCPAKVWVRPSRLSIGGDRGWGKFNTFQVCPPSSVRRSLASCEQ